MIFKSIIILLSLHLKNIVSEKPKYTREMQMRDQFDDFLKIHSKKYSDYDEYLTHFQIFHHNLSKLKNYRESGINCKQYLNSFSDLEYGAYYDSCKGFVFPNK